MLLSEVKQLEFEKRHVSFWMLGMRLGIQVESQVSQVLQSSTSALRLRSEATRTHRSPGSSHRRGVRESGAVGSAWR